MNIEIYKAELIETDFSEYAIEWEGNNGFGTITILDENNGYYRLDSEALSIETVIKIMQKVKL